MLLHGLQLVHSVEPWSLSVKWHVDSHVAAPILKPVILLIRCLFDILAPCPIAVELIVYDLEGQPETVADTRQTFLPCYVFQAAAILSCCSEGGCLSFWFHVAMSSSQRQKDVRRPVTHIIPDAPPLVVSDNHGAIVMYCAVDVGSSRVRK